jgi:hypothetical protein
VSSDLYFKLTACDRQMSGANGRLGQINLGGLKAIGRQSDPSLRPLAGKILETDDHGASVRQRSCGRQHDNSRLIGGEK